MDADSVFIDFNGRNLTWTDWVLEGYRRHGDKPFEFDRTRNSSTTNNFQRDARLTASNPALQRQLNTPEFKQEVEGNLRGTYTGDAYIAHVKTLLDPKNEQHAAFQKLRVATQIMGLRVAVQTAVDNRDVRFDEGLWLNRLVSNLPGSTRHMNTELSELAIGGRRIPGVWVLSQRYAQTPDRTASVQRQSFVYMPGAPEGKSLYRLDEKFKALLGTESFRTDVEHRVRAADRTIVGNALNGLSASGFRASLIPVSNFTAACDQQLRDIIDNTAEETTSKAEVIEGEIIKSARYLVAVACTVATSGVGVAPCAVGTGALMLNDAANVKQLLERGKSTEALMETAFLALDELDVLDLTKAVSRG